MHKTYLDDVVSHVGVAVFVFFKTTSITNEIPSQDSRITSSTTVLSIFRSSGTKLRSADHKNRQEAVAAEAKCCSLKW